MLIPTETEMRDRKINWIADTCFESLQERLSFYDRRRRYYLFGDYGIQRTLYNRLLAHTDLVASFLYAADKVKFTVAARRSADELVKQQMLAIEEDWNDEFRDSGLAYEFVEALQWAIVYDSMFLKVGWNQARSELFCRLVTPHEFGVFDESETDLDSQEAFTHSYALPWENACLRLIRAGKQDLIPRMAAVDGPQASQFPAVLSNMIISSTPGANLGGNVMGQVNPNYEPQSLFEPKSSGPKVRFREVWIWDDSNEDYMIATLVDPDIVIEDSRQTIHKIGKQASKGKYEAKYASNSNWFLPGEHPFTHVCPFKILDYFWGESHTERLIPLQKWTNERLDQIHEILEMQVDPAKVFSGFGGLTDEKAGALGGPGTYVYDQMPGAKVERLVPEMPEDLFAEFTSIGHLFLEASGLTETVMGKGETGVRGRGHAKQLATTGSGRIRKVAVGLEPQLVKLGDLGLKLQRMKDDRRLKTESGQEFVMAQVEPDWKMRVAGHSHSPLFSDEARELAALLFKAQAIDREWLIRLMHPPGEANLLHSLKHRKVAERKMAALNPPKPKGGKGNGAHPPAG